MDFPPEMLISAGSVIAVVSMTWGALRTDVRRNLLEFRAHRTSAGARHKQVVREIRRVHARMHALEVGFAAHEASDHSFHNAVAVHLGVPIPPGTTRKRAPMPMAKLGIAALSVDQGAAAGDTEPPTADPDEDVLDEHVDDGAADGEGRES
mgnify:CR=1 FL=1